MKLSRLTLFVTLLSCALWAAAAQAASSEGEPRKLGLTEAKEIAAEIREESNFPVFVNDKVLSWLNRWVGSSQGQRAAQAILSRREKLRPVVGDAMAAAGLPMELEAIPFIESGFSNIDGSGAGQSNMPANLTGAGIWQMIPSTGRSFGLYVPRSADSVKKAQPGDERMNPAKQTQAAIRMLKSLHKRFENWALAIAGYNQGSQSVERAVARAGTKNAQTLVAKGYINPAYLPKVMAAVIVLSRPELVRGPLPPPSVAQE